jgi:hypothetical protein
MNDKRVEDYLRKSTRGLWGKKRREVRNELATHIEGRVWAHLVAGTNELEAVEKTLKELGQPINVSAGMARLYTLPLMAGSGMMLAMCCALVVVLLSGSTAQSIAGTFYWPSEECMSAFEEGRLSSNPDRDYLNGVNMGSCNGFLNTLWLNFNDLKPIFEAKGVRVTQETNIIRLDFPDGKHVTFPPGNYDEFGNFDPCCSDPNGVMTVESGYFELWDLLKRVARNPEIPLTIKGWDNPTIHIDEVSFQIGTEAQPFLGEDFYNNYLNRVLFNLPNVYFGSYVAALSPTLLDVIAPQWDRKLIEKKQGKIKTTSETGVYGLIVVLDLENPLTTVVEDENYPDDSAFFVEVAQVAPDNTVTFDFPVNENVQFVEELKALPDPGSAILVDLSAKEGAWYSIIPPDEFSFE